jgi:hypothetical protein
VVFASSPRESGVRDPLRVPRVRVGSAEGAPFVRSMALALLCLGGTRRPTPPPTRPPGRRRCRERGKEASRRALLAPGIAEEGLGVPKATPRAPNESWKRPRPAGGRERVLAFCEDLLCQLPPPKARFAEDPRRTSPGRPPSSYRPAFLPSLGGGAGGVGLLRPWPSQAGEGKARGRAFSLRLWGPAELSTEL